MLEKLEDLIFLDLLDNCRTILTEHDLRFIENFLDVERQLHPEIHTPELVGNSRWHWKALLTFSVLGGGLSVGLRWRHITVPALLLGTCSAFNASYRLFSHCKRKTELERLKRLLRGWSTFTQTAKKVLRFLKEMELVEKGFMLPVSCSISVYHAEPSSENPLHCNVLRANVRETLISMCEYTVGLLVLLRTTMPLSDHTDSDTYYVRWEEFRERYEDGETSLLILKEVFNLWCILCSQLCRRLLLAIYDAEQARQSIFRGIQQFNAASESQSQACLERLQVSFKYYTSWCSEVECRRVANEKNSLEMVTRSLQSHLTALYLISSDIGRDKERAEIESLIAKMKQEQINLTATLELLIFELEKGCSPPLPRLVEQGNVGPQVEIDSRPVIVVDDSWIDVNEDEILEAYISREEKSGPADDCEELRVSREEYRLIIKEKKLQSKVMLNELQNVLKGRAEDWAEREAKARIRKYGADSQECGNSPSVQSERCESRSPICESSRRGTMSETSDTSAAYEDNDTQDPRPEPDSPVINPKNVVCNYDKSEPISLRNDVSNLVENVDHRPSHENTSSFSIAMRLSAEARAVFFLNRSANEEVIGDDSTDDER